MSQFANMSDDELEKHITLNAGPFQQAMIAESYRRLSVKQFGQQYEHLSKLQSQISEVRADISGVAERLEKTHKVHRWILLVAILTGVFALIAALDAVLKWSGGN